MNTESLVIPLPPVNSSCRNYGEFKYRNLILTSTTITEKYKYDCETRESKHDAFIQESYQGELTYLKSRVVGVELYWHIEEDQWCLEIVIDKVGTAFSFFMQSGKEGKAIKDKIVNWLNMP